MITVNFRQFRLTRKWVISAAAVLAVILLAVTTACTNSSGGQKAENATASTGQALIEANQPPPIFPTSAYRGNAIVIEAMQALGSPTTTFLFPPGANSSSGVQPIKVCASQGLPVAANTEITDPDQVVGTGNNNAVVTGQMDPNGTYLSPSTTGTNVLCLDAAGNPHLSYWEGDVEAESGTAVWSPTLGIVDQGPSQLPVCTVVTSAGENGIKSGTAYTKCVKAAQTSAWRSRWLKTDLALAS